MYSSELSFVGVLLYFKQYPCELKCVLKDLFVWGGLAPDHDRCLGGSYGKTVLIFFYD